MDVSAEVLSPGMQDRRHAQFTVHGDYDMSDSGVVENHSCRSKQIVRPVQGYDKRLNAG